MAKVLRRGFSKGLTNNAGSSSQRCQYVYMNPYFSHLCRPSCVTKAAAKIGCYLSAQQVIKKIIWLTDFGTQGCINGYYKICCKHLSVCGVKSFLKNNNSKQEATRQMTRNKLLNPKPKKKKPKKPKKLAIVK